LSFSDTDCIGSAFNVKGMMQCPNCRKIEKGRWLYASGPTNSSPELSTNDGGNDDYPFYFSFAEVVKQESLLPSMTLFFCSFLLFVFIICN